VSVLFYLFNFLLLTFLTGWLYRKFKPVTKWLFWCSWLLRVMCAIALGVIYQHYYIVGDTWNFFTDATQLSQLAKKDFSQYLIFLWDEDALPEVLSQLISSDRSLLLVKVISVLALLSNNNYWISCLYFSMISFAAAWFLFDTISKHFQGLSAATAIAVLFFPSVVFWSSGLIKETIALSAIYLITTLLIRYLVSQKVIMWEMLFSLIAFYFLWGLKYYWAALYAAVFITTLFVFFINKKLVLSVSVVKSSWLLIFILIVGLTTLTHPNFYVNRLLQVVVENNQQFVNLSKPGTYIQYVGLDANWWSVCMNAPIALFSGLFRPFVWEAYGLMGGLAAIENLLLLGLFIWWTMSRKKLPWNVLFPTIIYSSLLCAFLALSSPNFGTLSRYRIGFLPFLIFAISAYNPIINYLFRKRTDLLK
jgi:hypothetical protein